MKFDAGHPFYGWHVAIDAVASRHGRAFGELLRLVATTTRLDVLRSIR